MPAAPVAGSLLVAWRRWSFGTRCPGGGQPDRPTAQIKVIDVNDAVTRQLLAGYRSAGFAETLGDAPLPWTIIGRGDVLDVSIWEAPPAVLFGSSATFGPQDSASVLAASAGIGQKTTISGIDGRQRWPGPNSICGFDPGGGGRRGRSSARSCDRLSARRTILRWRCGCCGMPAPTSPSLVTSPPARGCRSRPAASGCSTCSRGWRGQTADRQDDDPDLARRAGGLTSARSRHSRSGTKHPAAGGRHRDGAVPALQLHLAWARPEHQRRNPVRGDGNDSWLRPSDAWVA